MNKKRLMAILGTTLLFGVGKVSVSHAQEQGTQSTASETAPAKDNPSSRTDVSAEAKAVKNTSRGTQPGLVERFIGDQREIWTSPAKLRFSDTEWLVPLSGVTAGLFVTDRDFSMHLSQNPTTISHYKTLSNAGVAALVGGAGGMWVMGHVSHNQHWSETGFLAGEAALNSLVAVESFKYTLRRDRPFQSDGGGSFFQSGGTSFPSEHAAAAWSVAGVIAHEYPGPFTKIMAYGLASLVSVSRVRAHQHFPSDVVVGSVIGNLVAQDIYSRHHDSELGGGEWGSISELFRHDGNSSPANQGSPYVPLDSWIYPAFDRLAAIGLIDSAFEGMKPWTRNECVRLLQEASESVGEEGRGGTEAEKTYRLLETEFREELEGRGGDSPLRAKVESVYARVTGIAGQPLTDGFHFGETIIGDYGRPYHGGLNSAEGFSAWTTTGHLVAYLRAEYQHAPSAPALSESAQQFIFSTNALPSVPPPTPFPTVNRFQLLDAYVGLNFSNWQITFGPQSLWWGPCFGGPLMFNDNAAPVNMLRISRVSPIKLPGLLSWLGPWRMEWFLGQLAGHDFVFQTNTGSVGQFGHSLNRQPFLDGAKFSFKPLPDFELGFSFSVVFAGGPTPLTLYTLAKSFSLGNGNSAPGSNSDPGDRRSGLDFTWRVPGAKNWLSFYTEALVEDEFSPIVYWRNSAIWSGMYLAQFPKLNKLDLRVEAGYTDLPGNLQNGSPGAHYGPGIFYSNTRYPSGSYTNDGNLLGNWMGRQSQGAQAWSTYRFSPRNFIQASFRHQKVSKQFMPGGATLTDVSMSADRCLRNDLSVSGKIQYERWLFPIITSGVHSNVTSSFELIFRPQSWMKK